MSHVTTSAAVSTAGLARGEISPQTQLASNERFQDLLKSYEHEQARAHAEVAQKTTASSSSTAKISASHSDSANPSSKAQSAVQSAKPVAQESTDSTPKFRNVSEKQPVSAKTTSSAVAQKSAPASSAGQTNETSSKTISQPGLQQKGAETTGKSQAGETRTVTKEATLSANTSDFSEASSNASDQRKSNVASTRQETSAPQEHLQVASSEGISSSEPSVDSPLSSSVASAEPTSVQDDKSPEAGSENHAITAATDTPEPLIAAEKTLSAHTETVPDENSPADSAKDTRSATHAENVAEAANDEEHVSRHDEQQPLLYQKTTDGTSTTYIEMNIGNHEKVHVEIGETATKEHRIHINTDNPEVYQSLKDDRASLLATLAQNSTSVTDLQSAVSADIQISLSTPSFPDMSSGGDRQDGNSQQSGSSRNASSVSARTTDERRVLRGVVDLTV
ncbi:hypothetical protein HKD24_11385 [Gluconobacter sp. LMG 31484]|uniref:Flagellar hook-length control protein FliK n=1 Tax=Gluconobacter vitians TaxID=2728102 RepID=A0ABR9Y7S2_9PROT|nr:flagellar hook-length control protein FliK [Gluconobacter vitians]MBF0859816.1 hypothetical protein [Gluconobacter vitians]